MSRFAIDIYLNAHLYSLEAEHEYTNKNKNIPIESVLVFCLDISGAFQGVKDLMKNENNMIKIKKDFIF